VTTVVSEELARVRSAVAAVPDPELPMVTIEDLGILRNVSIEPGGQAVVTITPTYSGCPAMETIAVDVRAAAAGAGAEDPEVRTVLAPAWTTDWITEEGRRKLAEAGISPPGPASGVRHRPGRVLVTISPRCPRCASPQTRLVSKFGSTACKAIYVCTQCREPFDHFKAI
jgi:ring-1,2-phenylacetyl-CoA epoxidase subunit PaaD